MIYRNAINVINKYIDSLSCVDSSDSIVFDLDVYDPGVYDGAASLIKDVFSNGIVYDPYVFDDGIYEDSPNDAVYVVGVYEQEIFENVFYENSANPDNTNPPSDGYMTINSLGIDAENLTFDYTNFYRGSIQVTASYIGDSGSIGCLLIADNIMQAFKRGLRLKEGDTEIFFDTPAVMATPINFDGWYHMPITLNYVHIGG